MNLMGTYTEGLGVTRGKGVIIASGQLQLARHASTLRLLQWVSAPSAPAAPSDIYLWSLETMRRVSGVTRLLWVQENDLKMIFDE